MKKQQFKLALFGLVAAVLLVAAPAFAGGHYNNNPAYAAGTITGDWNASGGTLTAGLNSGATLVVGNYCPVAVGGNDGFVSGNINVSHGDGYAGGMTGFSVFSAKNYVSVYDTSAAYAGADKGSADAQAGSSTWGKDLPGFHFH